MIIKEVLKTAIEKLKNKNIEDASMKVKMILSDTLNKEKEYLLVHDQDELDEDILKVFDERLNKLISGKPIQYILNKQDFMGLHFYVDENVLIPQPDTEILVEEIINNNTVGVAPIGDPLKMEYKHNIRILDLCTGSGAIGVSIAKYADNVSVTMSDISKNALEIAKKNAITNEVIDKCNFVLSDMFEDIEEKFDVIVSNPPYIKSQIISSLDKEVQNEPILALDGGEDGLKFYRVIAENAYKHLNKERNLSIRNRI